jgi:adenylylsulfate kinase
MDSNIVKHDFSISKADWENKNKAKAFCIFLTGLSGSGKSSIANEFQKLLFDKNISISILDGDNTRLGLCSDLGFSSDDRNENLRRISQVSKLYLENGLSSICSFIAPTKIQREAIKNIIGPQNFRLVYIKASVELCIERDPKGLYQKALAGDIKNFTGISSEYEKPINPDLIIETQGKTLQESALELLSFYQSLQ